MKTFSCTLLLLFAAACIDEWPGSGSDPGGDGHPPDAGNQGGKGDKDDPCEPDEDEVPTGGAAIFSRAFDTMQQHEFARAASLDLAPAPDGGAVVAGWFRTTITLDEHPTLGAGEEDAFLARYGPDGELLFASRFGDEGRQRAVSVATSAEGDIYVSGTFEASIDFGGGVALAEPPFEEPYIFLARFTGEGEPVWAQSFGPPADEQLLFGAPSLEVDRFGDVFAAFDGQGIIVVDDETFHAGFVVRTLITKFSAEGELLWGDFAPVGVDLAAVALDSDEEGNLYVAFSDVGFSVSMILLRWSPGGELTARGEFPATFTGSADLRDMAVAPNGDVYVVGSGVFGVTIDDGSFLARLDPDLRPLEIETIERADVRKVAATPEGSILVAGERRPQRQPFVAKLKDVRTFDWLRLFGGEVRLALGLASTPEGDALFAGEFRGVLDLGLGALKSPGERDLFLGKLAR
jgi:hypothetical protein